MQKSRKFEPLQYLLLIGFFLFIITPFLWLLYSSFRFETNMFSGEIMKNIGGFTFENYKDVIGAGPSGQFVTYFKNSLIIAVISTFCVMAISIFAAYALSRFPMRGKNVVITMLLSANMFPQVLLVIPLFGILFKIQLIDSFLGIILTHIVLGLPFSVWLVKGYFDAIPRDLDEAAQIDGLGPIKTLFLVILPISAPGVVVSGFYAFMVSWGDFLFASIISQSMKTQTLTIGLNKFFGSTQVMWGPINAAVVVTIIPTVILFAFLQKWIVEGLASGAVKG